jgi:cytochrome c
LVAADYSAATCFLLDVNEDPGMMRSLPLLALAATVVAAPALAQFTPVPMPGVPSAWAEADISKGEAASKKCQACHEFGEGAPSKLGPPMWGIVGQPPASVPGYSYSQTLLEMRDAGLVWTPEMLAPFLADPRAFAPGNKMSFAGIRNEDELASIIAYLVSISPGYTPTEQPTAPPASAASPSQRTR